MHSFTSHGVHFNYDPDFGSDVKISGADGGEGYNAWVPGKALLEFVWECYEKPRRIEKLEQMEWNDSE